MSVRELVARMPGIDDVRHLSRRLAALDAIMSPEWDTRYFSYDREWAAATEMASMRNGSGDEYWLVFNAAGACAIGFDHESVMSPYRTAPPALWPGLIDAVPVGFHDVVQEPAFCDPQGSLLATVCFWREHQDAGWSHGDIVLPDEGVPDPDGADWLFCLLAEGTPEAYQEFALDYYEVPLAVEDIRQVYDGVPMTEDLIRALNPTLRLDEVAAELRAMGYPIAD